MTTAAYLLFVISVHAQVSTANVSGEVEDPAGARLTSVTIKLLNLQTGNENRALTDASGEFLIPGVLPGLYSMQVQRDGFAAVHLTGLNLAVGESRRFLVRLRLSSVEQTVEVDASGQDLDTGNAQMSTVVDAHLVRDLPLNGRSFQDLIAMTPGSISVSPQVPRNGGFSVNGQSPDTNIYWVDGISGNFGVVPSSGDLKEAPAGQYASVTSLGTTHGLVALDALQEFRVVASTASAEYGSAPGGQFSLLTRQGTNQIHATAFAYLRNGYFDATDWFGGYNGIPNYFYYYQQDIGGSLGMPLAFKSKDPAQVNTHLFASYEEMHVQQRTAPLVQYIPNSQWVLEAPLPIQNAFRAFFGAAIPPAACNGSTCPGPSGPGLATYIGYAPSPPSFLRSMDFRIDHTLGPRFSGFVRFGDTPSGSQESYLLTNTATTLSNQSLTLGLDGQFLSEAGNEFRVGWDRTGSASVSSLGLQYPSPYSPPAGVTPVDLAAALGAPGSSNQTRSELYMRVAGIGDTSAWTDSGSNALRQIELRDVFSLQRSSHLIRAGIDSRNLHSAVRPLPWTIEADYLSLSSMLTNAADLLIVRRNEQAHPVFEQFAAFLQDQWRAARNLNVEAGVRWDLNPPPSASDNRAAFRVNGDPEQPTTLSVSPRGTALWKTDKLAFGPRIGTAWQPIGHSGQELVVRAGLGILVENPGRAAAPAYTGLGFTSTSLLPSATIPSAPITPPSPDFPGPGSLGYLFPSRLKDPWSIQWNVSLERAAGEHQSVSLSYVGASGHDLLLPVWRQIGAASLQEVVTFPAGYSSRFDSFQSAFHGEYHSRIAWMASYVWAHAMDFENTNPWAMPRRGNADTDVRHNLQTAVVWTLPSMGAGGLLHDTFSGWGIDSRYFLRSSYPITVLGNLIHDPVTGERFYSGADLIAGKPLYLSGHSIPGGRMLNGGPDVIDGAFQLPAAGSQGNAPRNMARGFSAQQLSLSLRREIPLHDRLHLQLRCDVFNVFNNPDFGYIEPNLTDQLFGQPILSLNQSYGQSGSLYQPGGPRSLQFMFRVRW